MLAELLKFIGILISLFKSLTPKQKEQVVNVFVDLFQKIFKDKKAKNKPDINNTTVQEAMDDITDAQWKGTLAAVTSILPSSFNDINKKKFADAMVQLVQSEEFLEKLNARIDSIDIKDNDLYTEQCSLEMRKLIAEMVREKKL